jgi:hypothetical protein
MGDEDVEMKDALPEEGDTGWGQLVYVDRPELKPWEPIPGVGPDDLAMQGGNGAMYVIERHWRQHEDELELAPPRQKRWRDLNGGEEEDEAMDVVADAPRPDAAAMEDAAVRLVESGEWSRDRMNAEWGAFLDEVADDLQVDRRYYFRCNRDVLKSAYAALITQGGSIDDVSNVSKALLQGMATYFASERDYGEQHEEKHRPFVEPKALNEAFAALPIGQQTQLLATDVVAEPDRAAVTGMLYMSGTHTIHVDEERFVLHPELQRLYGAVAFTWRAPRQEWDNRIRGFFTVFCVKGAPRATDEIIHTGKPVLDWMLAHSAYAVLALDTVGMIQGFEAKTLEPIGDVFSRERRQEFIGYADHILWIMERMMHSSNATRLRATVSRASQSLRDHAAAKEARVLFAGTTDTPLGSRLSLLESSGGDLTLLLGRVTLIQGDRPQPSQQALSALLSGARPQDDVD